MFKVKSPAVIVELEAICTAGGGVITPVAVVRQAKKKKSALHGYFEWDDTEAAQKYREHQARLLIRAVRIVSPQTNEAEDIFVNIVDDENKREYRRLVEVLSDEEMREQLLATALDELKSFRKKYRHLKELAAIFKAIDEAAA